MEELAHYERRFRRAGVPLLTEDYSAREDIFTRALPFLVFAFLIQMLNGVREELTEEVGQTLRDRVEYLRLRAQLSPQKAGREP